MAITDDAVAFLTNQIGIIISLVLTVIMGFRWLQRENKKHTETLETRIMGKEKDGKGGIVFDIRQEARAYANEAIKHTDTAIGSLCKDIQYMARDNRRMEKALEQVTRGHYVTAKSKVEAEEKHNDIFYDDEVEDKGF